MITVWTMCTGDKYPVEYVTRLQQSVAEHFNRYDHAFKCITEHDIEGVDCVEPPTPWPGWWGKIGLHKPGFSEGLCIWLDLDVVIVGDLDVFVDQYANYSLVMPANWAQSGHGGCQSSFMMWYADSIISDEIFNQFDYERDKERLWGDQEFITELRDRGDIPVKHTDPSLIQSYKYHVQGKKAPADNCRIVVFHGEPKPADVNEAWFDW